MTRNEDIVVSYFAENGKNIESLMAKYGLTKQDVYDIVAAGGAEIELKHEGPKRAPGRMTHALDIGGVHRRSNTPMSSSGLVRAAGGSHRRFVAPKAEPELSHGLKADHPAVVEGRTLFPTRVMSVFDRPRFLIDGKNNPKTGGLVEIGPWKDMPIFTLTLQERATCPRVCAMWQDCMGNTMPAPPRSDASDPDFIPALAAEVITLYRSNPKGMVIRLHILGDFFSVGYVKAWGHLLDMLPNLRVFGYTARRLEDPESAAIAAEIQHLNERWDRWAIRTSHVDPGPDRTIVVEKDPNLPDVLICPAQIDRVPACSACGICWAPGARKKTIAFLRHGMKGGRLPAVES